MNKWVIGTGIVAGLGAAWYFLVPPVIRVVSIDNVTKKMIFTVDGMRREYNFQNTNLGMVFAARKMFSISVQYKMVGSAPKILFNISKNGKQVSGLTVDLNQPMLGI